MSWPEQCMHGKAESWAALLASPVSDSLLYVMQKEDLARMYRLFSRIPRGLDPVADSFKRHVESEGLKLVKDVTEASDSKKQEAGEKLTVPNGQSHC